MATRAGDRLLKDEDVVVPSRVTAACQKVQSEFLFASPIDVESSRPTPAR
jgi:hypothetical protein